ncbi:MAG: hypothetical protein JRL30_14190 [Deltaproteobacteria bacterium]|nr:hypothetical protein [Deltaproteobacteria bacterium]
MDKEKAITEALEKEGWTRQFVASEPRLGEAVDVYKEAGFEVHLEPLPPRSKRPEGETCALDGECRACFEGFEDQYQIIFTRSAEDSSDGLEDELF